MNLHEPSRIEFYVVKITKICAQWQKNVAYFSINIEIVLRNLLTMKIAFSNLFTMLFEV